jgi:hypothetical protein
MLEAQVGKTPGEPSIVAVPVTITPEISEPVADIKYFSLADTDYTKVFQYKVEKGYRLYLNDIAIAPDTDCQEKGLFLIKIGSVTIEGIRLLTSWDTSFFWLQLYEGAEVSIYVKSTDGTTIAGNASYSGRRVRVEK